MASPDGGPRPTNYESKRESQTLHHESLGLSTNLFNTQVIVATLIVFLTILILYIFFGRKKARGRAVVFLGLCNSGKTQAWTRLLGKKHVHTVTSMKCNIGTFSTLKKKLVDLVDIPGSERIRDLNLDPYRANIRGVVFFVDSLTIQKEIRDVAECLYNILSDEVIHASSPPLLLFCNKHDQALAKSGSVICNLLEREIDLVRKTKGSQLASTEGGVRRHASIGKEGKAFEFSDLAAASFDVAEGFADGRDGSCDLRAVRDWLEKIA